jgi:L-ribulose-5-phosphate 4-epimerase
MRLQELREQVWKANVQLPKLGLVAMHSGNASGYDPESRTVLIKPSGVDYDALTPKDLVTVDIDTGEPQNSELRPSVDLPHHLYLYRNMHGVRGIVHTHSNHATAFAACHKPIPLALTSIADEFGGAIPCAPYVDNEGESIGRAIIKHKSKGPAILLANHGVFAWGDSPESALKSAAMVEDAAKTILLAFQIGQPIEIPPSEAQKWWNRYQYQYGQRKD